MEISIGRHVRITDNYPDIKLRLQTGVIQALPNAQHPDEYLIMLDGGITGDQRLAGRFIRIPAVFLRF